MRFLPSYTRRILITIDKTQVTADQTGFPVYVNLTNLPADFHANVNQTDGRDIRITLNDGVTEVPREVVYYDSVNDAGEMHFKADISSVTNSTFYIYYGNSTASDYGPTDPFGRNNVWDSNYKAVHHFGNGSSLAVTDSTGNNDLTNFGGTAAAGEVGGGVNLDGSSQYLTSALNAATIGSNFTISAWAYSTDLTAVTVPIAFDQDINDTGWILVNVSPIALHWQKDEPAFPFIVSTTLRSDDTWYNYTVTTTGSSAGNTKIYINGANSDNGAAVPPPDSTYTLTVGRQRSDTNPTGRFWPGKIDEVRISNTARSATWISTEYNNQSLPASFYSFGGQETLEAAGIMLNSPSIHRPVKMIGY